MYTLATIYVKSEMLVFNWLIQGPVYGAVGLKDKLGFGRQLIMLSSVCVEIQIYTETHSMFVLTEAHNKTSLVTDWQ